MNDLQAVALGQADADLVVRDGTVFRSERRDFADRDVAVVDGRVAALFEDASHVVGDETTVVDATDCVVTPGFVDAHTHVDYHHVFESVYHHVLAGGTTTVVSEAAGIGALFDEQGVEELLAATADLPIDLRVTVPTAGFVDTFEPQRLDADGEDAMLGFLDDDRVVGVGETPWIHLVGHDSPVERLYDRARAVGKPISGHGAGCRGEKLTAFASIVDNDHEAIAGEEVVERVDNGIHAIGRSGSIRDDIQALADGYRELGAGELSLSTDGMWPADLVDLGYMDEVLRRAIDAGVDPADALLMATRNPARHFGLSDHGSLSPGSVADVVVLDDLESVSVRTVVSGGDVVVEDGDPLVNPREHEYPDAFTDSARVDASPEAFRVPADAATDGRVRAVEYRQGLLSAETTVEPRVEGGELRAAPENDVLKATLLDRHPDGDGAGFTGFLTGFGMDAGAVASTIIWETPGVLAVGADDADMQVAAERVEAMGGGWAVVRDGDLRADLPAPFGGFCAVGDVEKTTERYDAVETALRDLGATVERPMLALQTLTFTGVPTLKLSFSGYADILAQRTVGLAID